MRCLLLLIALAGCGGGLPVATQADAARANVALADLQSGRSLVSSKCSACHAPPFPGAHTAAEWPRSVGEMAARSHLSADEHRQITLYLATMSR
jgi:cytochrome c5